MMYSFKSIVLIAAAFTIGAECSAVPAAAAAPLIAPAQFGYAHAVPQNIPPYASQVSVFNRALSPLVAAGPYAAPLGAPLAAPLAAPVGPVAAPLAAPLAGPYAAPVPAPFAPAPYVSGPVPAPYLAGPVPAPYALPAAYAAAPAAYAAAPGYAAPFPYSAPLLRSPYGYAPAYLR